MHPSRVQQLEAEIIHWANYNFPNLDSTEVLLSLVEETIELQDAVVINDTTMIRKEAGDTFITLVRYCAVRNYPIAAFLIPHPERWNQELSYIRESTNVILTCLGKIVRAHLKQQQKIRGTYEEHEEILKLSIDQMFRTVRILASRIAICVYPETYKDEEGWLRIIEERWQTIKNRDWQKDKLAGGGHESHEQEQS